MRRPIWTIGTLTVVLAVLTAAALWALRAQPRSSLVTVLEGLTVEQTVATLAAQTDHTAAEYRTALRDGSVTSALHPGDAADLRSWEGLLFPDTYQIADREGPAEILQLLADTTEARVAAVDWSWLQGRGLTPYQGLVIASLIEREAGIDADRPLISSVIHNRLEIGMRLQIDATVVYALGGYPDGGLTFDDLEVDSPYNTYRIDGLPPTPISGARLASLRAAAAPADTDYFFYVLASRDGSHAFATDYDEFLELVEASREAGIIP